MEQLNHIVILLGLHRVDGIPTILNTNLKPSVMLLVVISFATLLMVLNIGGLFISNTFGFVVPFVCSVRTLQSESSK